MANRREPLTPKDKRKFNKENFRKLGSIFRYLLPYKRSFGLGMLCLLVSSLTLLAFPYVASKLIDAATGEGEWLLHDINHIALALLGILFLQAVFSFFRVYLFAQVSERSMANVRISLFSKLMELPMAFYDSRRTGELLSRITSDVSLLQETFSITLAEFFRQIITLVIGTFIIFFFTPKLAFFMLATFPILVVIAMVFGNFIRKLSKRTQDELAQSNIIVEESLQSISIVKAFTSEQHEIGRYRQSQNRVINMALKAAGYRGGFISFIIFALFGGIVAVIWYGATLVASGEMSIGDLVSFVLYTTFIGGSIAGLGDLYGLIQKSIGASERVLEITGMEGEAGKKVGAALNLEGTIDFRNVSFKYPTRADVAVLQDLSLSIKAGEKIALVGHSGAGKSTIVQLLMRFYDWQEGKIMVDGKDIREYNLAGYRQHIGIVPQEVILFGGTIAENISYGKPHATEAEIKEAAAKANALQFIMQFPEGLQTLVGERGVKLSGGQRQRVAIARAILRNPKILILDEATSSLDAESEHLVQEALDGLMRGRTTIIIAHRLATIRKVDRIYVIRNGQIAESGTHEELLREENGTYTHLVRLQLQDN